MINMMIINGYKARINYDSEIEMFRGEFIGLNGGADFYAENVKGLQEEGEKSLSCFLSACKEKGIEPKKNYSGKFVIRAPEDLHENIALAAAASNKSLNQWVVESLGKSISM
jgi:predicted HicB family RNase H-like nuclease